MQTELLAPELPTTPNPVRLAQTGTSQTGRAGRLIVNADDWGRDRETTQRTLDCLGKKTVSSVSAMVFMEDSERASAIALDSGIDAGLHLNFTAPFSGPEISSSLAERHNRIASYLLCHPLARVFFHPALRGCFTYVLQAQVEEFQRLYGKAPARIDGHHHMHLCANVLFGNLLPPGTIARRNFSFGTGEKSVLNRYYRKWIDGRLAKRHRLTEFLFSLAPVEPPSRLQRIFSIARQHEVELETHPVNPAEYEFLTSGEFTRQLGDLLVAPRFALPRE